MNFAPGKVILTGEHSVVYGYPAIAMPVNLGVTISIDKVSGPSQCRQASVDSRLWTAMRTVVPENGYTVSIESTLPIGCGMGSSAALSVALIRAMADQRQETLQLSEELDRAMRIERIFHGNPSGIDHTVSALGESIYFQKSDTIKYNTFSLPEFSFMVVDSGTAGSTLEMVRQVAQVSETEEVQHTLKTMGQITDEIHQALLKQDLKQMGNLCLQNHRLLQKLGVSTDCLDQIVSEAINMGAWGAKQSGSGGGGIVLVFGPN